MKCYIINYKDDFSSRMLLPLVIFLVIFPKTLSSANYLSVGSSQYPHVAASPSASHGRNSANMQEKECFVARLCEYKILEENFSCKVSEYVISNGLERTLPKWLWLDEGTQTVKGIPSPSDEGLSEILIIGLRRHQDNPVDHICGLLTVKIVVWSLKYFPLFAQNIPTSPVIDDKFSKPSAWQSITCQFNEPIVLASLVLAGNFHEMDGKQKINVLDGLLQSYHISIYDVFMLSSNEEEPLRTSHVLASGPGANRSASGLSTTITWHVRCGIIHLDDSLFQVMEKLSQQLTFIDNVSYAPIGWHIVTGFQKYNVRRKRNIVGTTTPAYSTIPISRATVITTKIKITRTTYASQRRTNTWSRPLPRFSSPYTANKTSLFNQFSTITSLFNNTITPSQYNSVSSTLPVMSLSSTMSSLSQIISSSKQETSEISQYKSFSSTLSVMFLSRNVSSVSHLSPSSQISEIRSRYENASSTLSVISQSRKKSTLSQISSSKQQTSESEISHSTKMSSQMHSTLGKTRFDNLSTTSQLPSSKLSTFVQSSWTTSGNQRSTYMIIPSSGDTTSSIQPTTKTIINNTSLSSTFVNSLSAISSPVISSLFTSEQHSISTFRISSVLSTTAITAAIQQNISTSLLQPSYSNFIGSVSLLSSRTYSPVLHITTSIIINETISTTIIQTSYGSSTAHTRSKLFTTASPSTNVIVTTQRSYAVQRSNPTPTSSLPCTKNNCEIFTFSKNITPTSSVRTTPLYLTSSITSESILNTSRITGTLVLKTTSVTPQSRDVDKTPESTSPMLTPRIVSTSLQSSDHNISEIIKTSITNSIIHSSRLGTRSTETSNGAISSQVSSSSRKYSKFTSSSMVKPSSTGRTLHIMTSQSSSEYKSSMSLVSTTIFSTAIIYTPTEQLRSTHFFLIKSSPTATSTFSVQTKTIQSGSHITNIVPSPSASSLFTLPISGVISTSSSIASSKIATTLSDLLSSYHTRALSSVVATSTHSSEFPSSYKTATSTPSVATTTQSSSSDQLSSSHATRSSSSVTIVTPSSYFLTSYTTATSTSTVITSASSSVSVYISYRTPTSPSPSLGVTTTPSLHSLSSYKTGTSLTTVATVTSSLVNLLSSLHTPISPSSVISTIPSSFFLSSYHTLTLPLTFPTITSSSDFPSSYHSSTSSSSIITITPLLNFVSSYTTATSQPFVVTTISSSDQLSSSHTTRSLLTVATITSSSVFLISYTTATSTPTVVTSASLSAYISYRTPTSTSLDVTTTPSIHFLSSFKTGTSLSTIVTNTPSSDVLSSYHTTISQSSLVFTTPSSFLLSSYHTPTLLSTFVTITSSSDVLSTYHTPTPPSSVATTTPSSHFKSPYHTLSSPSSFASITSSLVFPSSYHTPTPPSSVATTTPSSHFKSRYHTLSPPSSFATITSSLVFPSSYHTPTPPSSVATTTPSSHFKSRYHTLSPPSSFATITSSLVFPSSYHTPTSPSTVVTITTLSEFLSSYLTSTSRSSVGAITPSLHSLRSNTTASSPTSVVTITSSPDYLSSYNTSTSINVTITHSSDLRSSYYTLASSSVVTTTPSPVFLSSYKTATLPSSAVTTTSSVFLPSYHTVTSPSSFLTITTPSDNAVTSPFSLATESFMTSLGDILSFTAPSSTPYKTFSLSFLSSSIASSQPFISSDLSMMMHSTIESSMTYTLTKLSSQTSWLPQPSYTPRQSPHTATVLLTRTSMKMPVITSSSGLLPSTTSSQSSSSAVTFPTTPSKESPKIYNNFDLLRVTVGEGFSVQIPADTFHDREDGNTRNLRLECLTVVHARLSSDSWLQFNSTTQTLYGLVLKSQLGEVSTEYLLTASDHDGNTVYDAFSVNIEGSAKPLAAMFSVKLAGINLKMFNRDLGNVLSIVQTIAGYYGDKDESLIQVVSLTEGSVIFTWSNTSLETCDGDLINDIASKLITRQGDIQPYFYNVLSPRFIAEEVFVNYTGPCVVSSTENPSLSELSSHETSPWLKYVLPALVVAVVIVVIAVAFLLVRRHSGVKILKEDKQIFRRRIPIILDGEQEMSTLSGKPIELPEDSLTPIRFPRETSLETPEYYDIPELPSPILPAPSYQRMPPRYSDGGSNRYNTPPPPYRLPPSY